MKDGWFDLKNIREEQSQSQKNQTFVHRCGGSTRMQIALCFPFNCRHDYASEHQNSGILALKHKRYK
jgi:hypothetical protein